ncbi:flagellar basal body-associated FliL family protein [Marinobacter sp. CHS3-4]|uniref:flagellar basal body-associated FliL family protein n=1 Tax=Marinobacter sp. CHS3-4 TaxID=3045174 RepID=UPI0024B5F12B|nr:flagellar basal body-associated FliL family protein [Marinobacter sp. CHS3-4]MDI9246471.1 flagellar basal body-associated FliL family protein [Marinobacter sp. CHS3-4]
MTLNLKRFLLILALLMPLSQTGHAQEEDEEQQNEEQAEEQTEESENKAVTDYIAMDPPFVTHVGTPDESLIYLKAAITLRASSPSTRPAIETHMPRLRHELVMLFGEQTDVDAMTSSNGQKALREEAKKRINQVLEEQQTDEQVTDVLFTEFVVQR